MDIKDLTEREKAIYDSAFQRGKDEAAAVIFSIILVCGIIGFMLIYFFAK